MALSAVIWRNRYWGTQGNAYGYASGHENHSHFEWPGTPGRVLKPGDRSYDECVVAGRWLQARGFRVAEHPAFGVVHNVHKGRGHYDHRALDVNFGPAGTNNIERSAFDSLIPSRIRQGVVIANVTLPSPPQKEEDMPNDDFFNLKFAALKAELGKLSQAHHDSLAERIAKVARFVKTGDDKILTELEELSDDVAPEADTGV